MAISNPDSSVAAHLTQCELGVTSQPLVCVGVEEHQRVAAAMIRQTERHLDIFSRDFDPAIYDCDECLEAFEALALRSRHSRIRVIVREPYLLSRRGHRVLRLGLRLSSYFHFRSPDPEYPSHADSFLVADGVGMMHRPFQDSLKSHASFCDPQAARSLRNRFESLWERAEPDPNLRSLRL